MHGSVAQLNPGIVSLLEGLGRLGQGPLHQMLTNVLHPLLFLRIFISKAVQGLDYTFIQWGGTLYTVGYSRDLKTEVNAMLLLLWLQNVMLLLQQQLCPVCQTCENPQQLKRSGESN